MARTSLLLAGTALLAVISASAGYVVGYQVRDDPGPEPDRIVGIRHGCSMYDTGAILEFWGREVCDDVIAAWAGQVGWIRRYAEVVVRTAEGDTYTVEVEKPSSRLDVGDVWFEP